jgi:hypothetical protein
MEGKTMRASLVFLLAVSACSSGSGGNTNIAVVIADGGTRYFGDAHTGNFWLGPVDYSESQWHNACAPSDVKYPALIQQLYGNYIMGLANQAQLGSLVAGNGQLCDVCAELTANGNTLVAHVITYGDEGPYPDNIDVSPEIRTALLANTSDTATWRFVTCPTSNPIYYTFDDREWTSNPWYFRVWVRNSRVPVANLEYALTAGAWSAMDWQSDGAWQASGLDFSGGFSLRVTSVEGSTIVDTLAGVGTFDPNAGVASHTNFE